MRDAEGAPEYHYVLIDYLCRVAGGGWPRPTTSAASHGWLERARNYPITEGTLPVIQRASNGCRMRIDENQQRRNAGIRPLRDLVGRFVSSPLGRRSWRRSSRIPTALLRSTSPRRPRRSAYLRSAAQPQPARVAPPFGSTSTASRNSLTPFNKLRIEGATLEPKEIFDLFAVLDRAADAKSILNAVAERFPRLGRAGADRRVPHPAARSGRQDPTRRHRRRSCQRRARRVCGATSSGRKSDPGLRSNAS